MIRIVILGSVLALALASGAQAEGIAPGREPGYGGPRPHRVVHHRRVHGIARRPVIRHASPRLRHGPVAPGGVTESLNLPIYNVPPHRFP